MEAPAAPPPLPKAPADVIMMTGSSAKDRRRERTAIRYKAYKAHEPMPLACIMFVMSLNLIRCIFVCVCEPRSFTLSAAALSIAQALGPKLAAQPKAEAKPVHGGNLHMEAPVAPPQPVHGGDLHMEVMEAPVAELPTRQVPPPPSLEPPMQCAFVMPPPPPLDPPAACAQITCQPAFGGLRADNVPAPLFRVGEWVCQLWCQWYKTIPLDGIPPALGKKNSLNRPKWCRELYLQTY